MNELIIMWLLGCAIVGSILMWWFNTSLPVHILEILRMLGYRRKNTEFWSVPVVEGVRNDLADFTKQDLQAWMQDHLPAKLAELLSCPGCFSAHASFWVAAGMQLFLPAYSIPFFLACWFGWPCISSVLFHFTSGKLSTDISLPSFHKEQPDETHNEETKAEVLPLAPTVGNQPADTVVIDQEAVKKTLKNSHALLRERGIKFHEKEDGTIHIDYMPRREHVIGMFLEGEKCPEEVPGCDALKAQMQKDIEDKGGASCPGCERNKIRNKYRTILTNILKDVPNMD